jgi:membrane protein
MDYKDLAKRLYQKVNDDDILGNAAQVAFYFSFAIFPLLLFLMTLLGIILSNAEEMDEKLFQLLAQVMPASASDLVQKTLTEVTSNASGGKLTVGVLITLYSASAGIDNVRGTLNDVYNLKETRSVFRTKLTSLLLTLAVGVLILIAIAAIAFGSQVLSSFLPTDSPYVLMPIQWIVLLILVLLAFALLYNFAPNHDPIEWKWITPGAVIGVGLWVLATVGFRIYLHYFDSYAATYGSLGAVIILMLWLYITALVILIGGAINALMDEESGVVKENADPKQVVEEKTQTSKEAQN